MPKRLTLAVIALLSVPYTAMAETDVLTVAGGCFWCVESDFEQVRGVTEVVSGFTGGKTANPSYKQVTKGGTGHYEAVQITFDSSVVSRAQLLSMFIRSVDPTDPGGQFCDRGDGYRTAVFAGSAQEKQEAKRILGKAEQDLGQPIVTPVLDEAPFYPAEAGHQDYYKSSDRVLTRFGVKKKSDAYKRYREACGRDARVRQLWGAAAPFAN